jgi:hypothetical protein
MEAQRMPPVLIVHPSLAAARRVAEELAGFGFTTLASDELASDYDHQPLSALVIFGSLRWWGGVDDDRALPPTVLVGGDSLGLARAAGVTRCPDNASAECIAHSLRSLLRLSRHSRGRGTMPMRISAPFIVKVGRWMTALKWSSFEEETRREVRPSGVR